MVTPEADEVSDKDFSDMNPSSPSADLPPSAETQRSLQKRPKDPDLVSEHLPCIFAGRR